MTKTKRVRITDADAFRLAWLLGILEPLTVGPPYYTTRVHREALQQAIDIVERSTEEPATVRGEVVDGE